MNKLYIAASLALMSLTASAQQTVALSTYQGTDISRYEGKTVNVTTSRHIFTGWNTIALPFSLTASQVDEIFGADCKLEILAGAEKTQEGLYRLNFQDCKSQGIKANTPYILHYTGETGTKRISATNTILQRSSAAITYNIEGTDATVTMACADKQISGAGLYGILAKDNQEASFVNVSNMITNGFYATRCYIKLSNGTSALLTTNHIGENDVTAISNVLRAGETTDVYNLSGVKVASQISASDVNRLQPGIYVAKGKKVMVK